MNCLRGKIRDQDGTEGRRRGNSLKHVIPVMLDKVLLHEGYFKSGTGPLGVLPVLLTRTLRFLVDLIPILHKHTDHVES